MFAGRGRTPTPKLAAAVRRHAQAVKDAVAAWRCQLQLLQFRRNPSCGELLGGTLRVGPGQDGWVVELKVPG